MEVTNKMSKSNKKLTNLLVAGTIILTSTQALAHNCDNNAVGTYHKNSDGSKGGFVQSTAFVDPTNKDIYIGKNTSVCDFAIVQGGKVLDHAVVKGNSELNGGIIRSLAAMSGGINNGAEFKGNSKHTSGTIGEGYIFNGTFEYSGQELETEYNFKPRFTNKLRNDLPKFQLEEKLKQSKQVQELGKSKSQINKDELEVKITKQTYLSTQYKSKIEELEFIKSERDIRLQALAEQKNLKAKRAKEKRIQLAKEKKQNISNYKKKISNLESKIKNTTKDFYGIYGNSSSGEMRNNLVIKKNGNTIISHENLKVNAVGQNYCSMKIKGENYTISDEIKVKNSVVEMQTSKNGTDIKIIFSVNKSTRIRFGTDLHAIGESCKKLDLIKIKLTKLK